MPHMPRRHVRGPGDPVVHAVLQAPKGPWSANNNDLGLTGCVRPFAWDPSSGIETDDPVTCLECIAQWRNE